MITAAISLFVVTAGITAFLLIKSRKIFAISLIAVAIVTTVGLCTVHPILHKQISVSIIDYLLKFNTDGSVTTTKQTTTTVIQEGNN